MDFGDKLKIPYAQPTDFTDAYRLYSADQKELILSKPKCTLGARELNIIFRPRPIGAYQESVYYLPEILNFIFHHYWACSLITSEIFQNLLDDFFSWTVMYYQWLKEDNIWHPLDDILYQLFCRLTSKYELDGGEDPIGCDYVSSFFEQFNHLDDRYEFPRMNVDIYLKRRFSNPQNYIDYAWLIYMFIGYSGSYLGLRGAQNSDILSEFQRNKDWHSGALNVMIKKVEESPEVAEYWSRLLDQGMIFLYRHVE